MLPNWLLGKSKSKLQEILGGGGGGTNYTAGEGIDISNGVISFDPETTPAIDPSKIDGLDDDLAALVPKTAISNPNIFHNPWFSVNQRAVTSATQNADYIADRWMVYFGENNATITRNNDGNIVMDNSLGTTNITIYQKRTQTYLKSLVGQKLTASMMLSNGTIYSGTITYTGTGNPVYFENDYVKAHAPVLTANQIITFSVKPGASVTIKALKLEVGEISTLHLDPRPEYAIELAKCQRYFYRCGTSSGNFYHGIAQAVSQTQAVFNMICPTSFRANPTITITSVKLTKDGNATSATSTSATLYRIAPNSNNMQISFTTSGLTTGDNYLVRTDYIDFNAEL